MELRCAATVTGSTAYRGYLGEAKLATNVGSNFESVNLITFKGLNFNLICSMKTI
jgi:hypothetical protein